MLLHGTYSRSIHYRHYTLIFQTGLVIGYVPVPDKVTNSYNYLGLSQNRTELTLFKAKPFKPKCPNN